MLYILWITNNVNSNGGGAWPKTGHIASIFDLASKPFTRHKMKTPQDSALLFFNINKLIEIDQTAKFQPNRRWSKKLQNLTRPPTQGDR